MPSSRRPFGAAAVLGAWEPVCGRAGDERGRDVFCKNCPLLPPGPHPPLRKLLFRSACRSPSLSGAVTGMASLSVWRASFQDRAWRGPTGGGEWLACGYAGRRGVARGVGSGTGRCPVCGGLEEKESPVSGGIGQGDARDGNVMSAGRVRFMPGRRG